MCDWCKNVLTQDDFNELVEFPLSVGVFGTVDIGADLARASKGKYPVLRVYACGRNNAVDKVKAVKIRFCPMCGEDLWEAIK